MRSKVLLTLPFIAALSFAAWEEIGPYGGGLATIAIAPSDGNIVYCVTNTNDVYRSVDAAGTWTKVGTAPGSAVSMAIDPTDVNTVYLGGLRCLYRSTDTGFSWSTDSVSNGYLYSITVHPTVNNILYAAGGQMVSASPYMAFFRSTDSGDNWTYVILSSYKGTSQCLALDQTDPNIIYVGGSYTNAVSYPAVYKSTNGGSSFVETSSGFADSCYVVQGLATHPTNQNIIYAGTGVGLYRSTNAGAAWQYVSGALRAGSIATTPASPNTAYCGTDTIIYKTTNSGTSWFIPGWGYATSSAKGGRQVTANQNSATVVYTADAKGCFKTTNGGTNWYAGNNGILMAIVAAIKNAPALGSTIYMQYARTGVFKSTNSGTPWIDLNTPSTCGGFCDLEVHNTNSNLLFGIEGSG